MDINDIEEIMNIEIPLKYKPNGNDYILNKVLYIRTYSEYKIKDNFIEDFQKESPIRKYMEEIIQKYNLNIYNKKLILINNPEWYDNFEVVSKN